MNDLRIGGVGAHHPVESHRQSPRRRHFGYPLLHRVAAVLVLLAKPFVQPHRRLRCFHQQPAHKAVPLLANRAQLLPPARGVFPRNQSQIAGHLLATLEPRGIADGHPKRQ